MMNCCCCNTQTDYDNMDVIIDVEPQEVPNSEPKAYSFPVKAITQIGHRDVDGWAKIVGMHLCAIVCFAAVTGVAVGAIVTSVLKK